MSKHYLPIGSTNLLKLPYSEVCMHLGVAGRTFPVKLLTYYAAQILQKDGAPFSFPILASEAGIYQDAQGFYVEYLEFESDNPSLND